MELKNIITIKGQIKLLSGLHIGGSKEDIEIGGIDTPVIKHPITKDPYIPGSSLKGKMRSLMEWYEDRVEKDGKPHTCGDSSCPICRIFGTTEKAWQYGPTRLVVRDSYLNDEWKTITISKNLLLTEEKVENSINRLEGKAISPRTLERVPAGAIFDFEMSYKIMEINGDENTDEKNLKKVFIAMKLVELDTLGGSGSRGYGKIKFTNLKKVINNNEEDVTLPEDIFEKDKK